MADKLELEYNSTHGDYRAEYKGLRVRAVIDTHPSSPFEDDDGHFPMLVRLPDGFSSVLEALGSAIKHPLNHFNGELLVHLQVNIAKIFGSTVKDLIECYDTSEPVGYCRDAEVLIDTLTNAIDDTSDRDQQERFEQLYELLGYHTLHTEVCGYSQGDWADLLIVATPEALTAMQGADWAPTDEERKDWIASALQGQADLYKAWAFGDVYGYIVERVELDEDDEEIAAEELDSCWGFYGSDHDQSGLLDAALESADHHAKEKTDAVPERA